MILDLAAVIAPVVICAAIGFVWARSGYAFESEFVTRLVTIVGTPALVASTFAKLEIEIAAVATMALAALAALVAFAALGVAVLKVARLPLPSFLPALMFPNAGNMGLPLCLFAFGEAGLTLAIVYFAVFSIAQFTAGVAIAAGTLDVRRLLTLPLPYAVAISVALMVTGTELPQWVANTLELVGGLTIPLMLMALGVSLARLRIASVRRSLGLAVLRLAGGLAVALLIVWALDLPQPARGVMIIQSAMPVAVFNYLFAQLYNRAPEEVAGTIVISTALSFATLPLLLLLAL